MYTSLVGNDHLSPSIENLGSYESKSRNHDSPSSLLKFTSSSDNNDALAFVTNSGVPLMSHSHDHHYHHRRLHHSIQQGRQQKQVKQKQIILNSSVPGSASSLERSKLDVQSDEPILSDEKRRRNLEIEFKNKYNYTRRIRLQVNSEEHGFTGEDQEDEIFWIGKTKDQSPKEGEMCK
ncbi:unnamed protein product, partial [Protopolystoma xenopodis]